MKKKPFAVNSFELFRKEKFWKQQWNNKLQGYMTEKPKLGLLIHKWISCGVINGVESICEVAAGSCVSSLYLSKFYDVTATDFNTYGFAAAQKMSSTGNYRLRFKEENAFSFSFPNNEYHQFSCQAGLNRHIDFISLNIFRIRTMALLGYMRCNPKRCG